MKKQPDSLNISDRIAKLYVPTLFAANKKELDEIKANQIADNSQFRYASAVDIAVAVFDITTVKPIELQLHFFDWFTGRKKLKEAQHNMEQLYEELMQNYTYYKEEQDSYAVRIQEAIDKINEIKCDFKEEILPTVSRKLKEMGIQSAVNDYHIEKLDKEILGIDNGLETIIHEMERFKTKITDCNSFITRIRQILMPFESTVLFRREASKINKEIARFEKESKYESKKFSSDLKKIARLEMAMTNVKNIFVDIKKNLFPLITDILDDINSKYHSNYDEIPEDKKKALNESCKILKEMAEKTIIPDKSCKETITEDVEEYSNGISINFNKVKEEIYKIA